jgi:hypothetical protein
MDTLPSIDIAPRPLISPLSTPEPLREILLRLYQDLPESIWLVGGTAIAGYFAEHRRSDDLDLFAADAVTHEAAIRTLRALVAHGLVLTNERRTPTFFHADACYNTHAFTIDIVLDTFLHSIGSAFRAEDGVTVANATTLFATKSATLLSRCSEKDLYDLWWFFDQLGHIDIATLINTGAQIDGGLTAETLLISLQGTTLREDACHFALSGGPSIRTIYRRITGLRKDLIAAILAFERASPPSPVERDLTQNLRAMKKQ